MQPRILPRLKTMAFAHKRCMPCSASISAASTRGRLSFCMSRKLDRYATSLMYRRSSLPLSLSSSTKKPSSDAKIAGANRRAAQRRQTTNALLERSLRTRGPLLGTCGPCLLEAQQSPHRPPLRCHTGASARVEHTNALQVDAEPRRRSFAKREHP